MSSIPQLTPQEKRANRKASHAKWRANNVEYLKEKERNRKRGKRNSHPIEVYRKYNLKKKYGLTLEQYQAMFAAQNGYCAACHLPQTEGKILVVDHDHTTGKVRGLIHNTCNSIIGFVGDDPTKLRMLADYLEGNYD